MLFTLIMNIKDCVSRKMQRESLFLSFCNTYNMLNNDSPRVELLHY